MHDALAVGGFHGVAHLGHELEAPAAVGGVRLAEAIDALTAHELHREPGLAVRAARVDDGRDARMLEPCQQVSLAFESLPEVVSPRHRAARP